MEEPRFDRESLEQELQRFPAAVAEGFRQAASDMTPALPPDQLATWARQGVDIAQESVRSWEAAAEYFRVSPAVHAILPSFPSLVAWAHGGLLLSQASPAVAVAYFRASPLSLDRLRSSQVPAWAEMGRTLDKGTWKSSALACAFFDSSPELLQVLAFPQLQRLQEFLELMSKHSLDLAQESLTLAKEAMPLLGESRDSFISLVTTLAAGTWRQVQSCFAASMQIAPRVEESQRGRLFAMAERLAHSGHPSVSAFLQESSEGLAQTDRGLHSWLLSLGESIIQIHPPALHGFLKSSPNVLERITPQQMELWFTQGAQLLRESPEGGVSYFRLESARSQELLAALSSAVELSSVKEVMRMYCHALAGVQMEIALTQALVQKGIGWVSNERPTTEGTTIYLPPVMDRYQSKQDNFGWLKVVATHQVAHREFGSFDFTYDRPSTLFRDLRPRLDAGAEAAPRSESLVSTDMHRFFNLFQDRKLALDLFTVAEDGRLDTRVQQDYPGIRSQYLRVQEDSLAERPTVETLPAREALVEFLVRLSLRLQKRIPVPQPYVKEARSMARLVRRILVPTTTVEDAAEATIRIYAILVRIPNVEVPKDQFEEMDVTDVGGDEEPQDEEVLEAMAQQQPGAEDEEAEQPYASPQDVEYRGDFKPELVQLLNKLKAAEQAEKDAETSSLQEMLEALLAQSAELQLGDSETQGSQQVEAFASNLMREAGVTPDQPAAAAGYRPTVHTDEEGGPLEATEPNTQVYDEWDFRAGDYKPRWCMVREKWMTEGDLMFWYQTLQEDAGLVVQIRREFEMLAPENLRKIRPLLDGEDYDLDSAMEFIMDLRSGSVASDKVYWWRNKIERDVAVLFLLDVSASTAEAIDESRRQTDEWNAPTDPVQYMLWLRSRRGEGSRRSYKRIIDLEKESIVLLIQALETLGDTYGIYAFSGYGRENVEFYNVKDLGENLSDSVRKRIDRIAPLHATRMGPAIRHSTAKLAAIHAKTKILFLISDGRPQDRGYSREGVEKEYAVNDTHQALMEAYKQSITPFCLTVDKSGHDYLKAMCGDMAYEVLTDVQSLPQRLPELYRRLTV